jgi:aspartyl-tRNA(Asn)/glutamyl-tRNA(Gln) amidotransferase subunit A
MVRNREQRTDVKGLRIGLPCNYFSGSLNEDVKAAVLAAVKEYEAAGAVIEEFEMPLMDYVVPVYYIISSAEASSNLAKYDGLKYGYRSPSAKTLSEVYRLSRSQGFGLEVKKRIMFGSFVLSSGYYDAYYKKALKARTLIKETYKKLFTSFDMILSPVSLGRRNSGADINENIFTASVNLAGLPAAALPCGFDKDGLPIGFQLIGDSFSENKLINAAQIYQGRTDYHTKRPRGAA